MDLAVLQTISRELDELLAGCFINKIHQPLPREIVLAIRLRNGGGKRLAVSADPLLGRIHLTDLRIPNPPRPPRFCAFLRAHLQGSRIVRVRAGADDRVVTISTVRGADPNTTYQDLVLELLGRDSNILLVDGASHRIMDCLHHIPPKETGSRVVLPGVEYAPPPKRGAHTPLPRHDLETRVTSPGIRVEPGGKKRLVVNAAAPKDEVFSTMNEAAEAFYRARLETVLLDSAKRQAALPLKARMRSLERRVTKIRADDRRLTAYMAMQEEGELIKANLHAVKKGMDRIEVKDWGTGQSRVIKLDPALGPVANMERIFKKAAKGKRGEGFVQRRLEETLDEKNALEDTLFYVEQASNIEELELAASWGIDAGPRANSSDELPARASTDGESKLFHEFLTPAGLSVFVGKSSRGNDFLLRRKARKGDLWFHVKGAPGAHVLLLERGKQPVSEQDIEFAAGLAVAHSKAKGKVEVMVADVKDLRRPKGALPGHVTVKKYKTLIHEGV